LIELLHAGYLCGSSMITLTAHGLVHVLTADHLCDMLRGCADVETRREIAALANSLKLLNLLTFWHELDDGIKHGTDTCCVQGCHNHNLALVGCILAPSCNLSDLDLKIYYILEELSFVDTDDIIELPLFSYVGEASCTDCFRFMSKECEIRMIDRVSGRSLIILTCHE